MRVERVHRVVLGRGEHAPVEHERLRVDRGVEVVRPRLVRGEQRGLRRVVPGALRVPVVDGPGRTRRTRARRRRRPRGPARPRGSGLCEGSSVRVLPSGGGPNLGAGYPARRQRRIEVGCPVPCRCPAMITTRSSPPTVTPAPATRRTASTSKRGISTTSTRGAGNTATRSPICAATGGLRNWDDELRNSQLEADGIVGEVVFPNTVPPFFPSFVLFARPPKPDEYEHRLAGIRAHNRWLSDWCARFPERRAGIGQIFLNDVDDAIDDVRWISENGLRGGVLISAIPPDVDYVKPLYDPVYEPLWSVCEDLGVKVNSHGGTGLPELRQVRGRRSALHHRGLVLLAATVRAAAALGRVRAASSTAVRHDRDGLRVAAADARALRLVDQEDQHDRFDGRAPLHRRAQAAAARERLLPPELLGRRESARARRRTRPRT